MLSLDNKTIKKGAIMIAVIDIGANSIRCSFYTIQPLTPVINKKQVAGLAGDIVDSNLSIQGINKLIQILRDFKVTIERLHVERVIVFATASLRNCANREEVVCKVFEETGFEINVLSGQEEANFAYLGAKELYDLKDGLLIDIGGGSTELVFYRDYAVQFATSLNVGSLTLYNKWVSNLIPTLKEMENIESEVKNQCRRIKIKEDIKCDEVCGVGGSIRAAFKLKQAIHYDKKSNSISCSDINRLLRRKNKKEYISKIIKVAPDRIHTITVGLIILKTITKHFDCQKIFSSDYGVREGYLRWVLSHE